MKGKICVLGLSAMALWGCGGGGSSGGVEIAASNGLEGTWVQTTESYTDLGGAEFEWVKTERKTIIVERDSNNGDRYYFTNCIRGTGSGARRQDDVVMFDVAGLYDVDVISERKLYTHIDCSAGCSTGIFIADVTLDKISNNKTPKLASIAITNPVEANSWDQVCIQTIEDYALPDEITIVADNYADEATLELTIETTDKLAAGNYSFPPNNIGFDIEVYLTLSGVLYESPYDGTGELRVTEGSRLVIDSSLLMNGETLDSVISLDSF